MKIFKKLLYTLVFALLFQQGFGQEMILPLEGNDVVKKHAKLHQVKKAASDVMLELPIIDDFSQSSPFPDSNLWMDNYAFINNTYAVDPVSSGVATLDAINEEGAVYANATIDPRTFSADFLTSHPVNLNYPTSDSLWFSFFYQPAGLGLTPGESDSLCLDFYNPTLDKWSTIWQTTGDTLKPFKQVMIAVKDTAYLKQGFQFRFRNRASLPQNADYSDKRGNVDHWHVDYVRLDRLRSHQDIVLRDVAFSRPLPSMLKEYQSIPWDHFSQAYTTHYLGNIEIEYFNNDTAIRNVTRYLNIQDLVFDEENYSSPTSTQDIFPGTSSTSKISSIYPFEFDRGDTAHFEIKSYLRTDDFDYKKNDTLTRIQLFRDYFARDDGSAERAYGLRGQGTSGGVFAVRFESFVPDELGGLDIYFAQLKDSLNLNYYFKFKVWDDNDGMPGNVLYDADIDYKVFYPSAINKYRRIRFANTVPVDGTFYVGILQYNKYMLNVGLDVNNPANGNLVYNLGSGWSVSDAPGSLMIRPYVLRDFSAETTLKETDRSLILYPNPVSDYLHLKFPEQMISGELQIDIYNIAGQKVISEISGGHGIYVGDLPEGIYIATFHAERYTLSSERFIISK